MSVRWTSPEYEAYTRRKISNTKPERHKAPALGGSHKTPVWTENEDAVLSGFYMNHPAGIAFSIAPLVSVLNRSEAAIHCRANALGLTFERGKYPRKETKPYVSQAKYSDDERARIASDRMKQRHATTSHPMLGKPVPKEVRDKISAANTGRIMTEEEIQKRLRTRAANGTMAPNHAGRSWKAGWREIGGQRIYARSRWEANYARYLEFLKKQGSVRKWEHEPQTFWFNKIRRGARSYLPDFRVTFAGGEVQFHEVKGWMDSRSQTKIKRMRIYHPTIVLRVIGSDWFKANRSIRNIIPGWERGKI